MSKRNLDRVLEFSLPAMVKVVCYLTAYMVIGNHAIILPVYYFLTVMVENF